VLGALSSVRKSRAREADEEDAAAATEWRMSETPRVVGSMRRSFVKVLAMPPVAGRMLVYCLWLGRGWDT
jgi:hypothetical protein